MHLCVLRSTVRMCKTIVYVRTRLVLTYVRICVGTCNISSHAYIRTYVHTYVLVCVHVHMYVCTTIHEYKHS